ncbi:membrane-spanning 4-domains subfamily A member 4A-like isoform X1 [Lissotriton helveticus]
MASSVMMPNGVLLTTVPVTTVIQLPGPSPEIQSRFLRGEPKALGVVQIILGMMLIALGSLLLNNPFPGIYANGGVPFWGATFYIISGAISVAAEKKGTSGLVRGSMAMNIVSTIITIPAIIITSIDILVMSIKMNESSACDNSPPGNDGQSCSSYQAGLVAQQRGVTALALILNMLELCITLSTSIFACKAVCQCCRASKVTQSQPMFVVQNTYGQELGFPPVQEPSAVFPPPYNAYPVTNVKRQ